MTLPAEATRLDVALAFQRIGTVFWHDFAAIIVLGFVMVTLPGVVLALAGTHAGSTIVATFGGMLRVLYVVIVTHGVLARVDGRPQGPRAFVRAGIAASPRALNVALLIGVMTVLAMVGLLLSGLAGPSTLAIRATIVAAGFAGAVLLVAAVPVALVERRAPFGALGRASALTRGNRGRVAVVLAGFALTVVPARLVLAATVYGTGASAQHVAAVDAAMTVLSPGLWLIALFDLLAWGVGAVIPGVIYAGLTRD
ncbi:hypothetical protein [Polymorphobacter megasporae]|uniref:hypothetical protein n=1 Tax=Glacieibacterium megasporae TaxID=2835787 RepID=UPI001C1E41FB|nr:hypothetical protein [Polymorphobacter megasporae]UAJ10236.1 hypothetical protein KTC28_00200 [Polymorphobacter megasporae]